MNNRGHNQWTNTSDQSCLVFKKSYIDSFLIATRTEKGGFCPDKKKPNSPCTDTNISNKNKKRNKGERVLCVAGLRDMQGWSGKGELPSKQKPSSHHFFGPTPRLLHQVDIHISHIKLGSYETTPFPSLTSWRPKILVSNETLAGHFCPRLRIPSAQCHQIHRY
jgi:hypothetical protein